SDIKSGDLANLAASPPANLVTETDPFPNSNPDQNWPNDSTMRLEINKSFLPTGAVLVNVCSYPSLGDTGNNNPFDCIVAPGGGFLNIVKVAPNGTTQEFSFTVNPGNISKSITGAGSTGAFGLPIGSAYSVAEEEVTGWELEKAACALEGGTATGTKSGNAVEEVTVESGKVTTCTFTNFNPKPKLGLTKKDDLNPLKFQTVGQEVTYTLVATNEGNTTLHKVEVSDSPALEGFSCTPSIPVASLAPEGKVECTGTHKITQARSEERRVGKTGRVTSEGGTKTEDKDKVEADQKLKLGLTKKDHLNPDEYDHVGQVSRLPLVSTNEGNTTLHKVEVSDSPALEGFSCTPSIPVASLAPEGKVECTGTHKITQA